MADRAWGERLAQARRMLSVAEWRDVSQDEIGALIDRSGATISRYERGLLPVPKTVRIALEAVLTFPPIESAPADVEPDVKQQGPRESPDEFFGRDVKKKRGGSK